MVNWRPLGAKSIDQDIDQPMRAILPTWAVIDISDAHYRS
jgi:hypothetical protein